MLRNTQIKIILVLLILGIIIIGTLGYINYATVSGILTQTEASNEEVVSIISEYQTNLKMITLGAILIFSVICALVRSICYRKNNWTNNKNY